MSHSHRCLSNETKAGWVFEFIDPSKEVKLSEPVLGWHVPRDPQTHTAGSHCFSRCQSDWISFRAVMLKAMLYKTHVCVVLQYCSVGFSLERLACATHTPTQQSTGKVFASPMEMWKLDHFTPNYFLARLSELLDMWPSHELKQGNAIPTNIDFIYNKAERKSFLQWAEQQSRNWIDCWAHNRKVELACIWACLLLTCEANVKRCRTKPCQQEDWNKSGTLNIK